MNGIMYFVSALVGFGLGFVVCALLSAGKGVEYIYIEDDGEGGARERSAPGPAIPPTPTMPDYMPTDWDTEPIPHPRVSRR